MLKINGTITDINTKTTKIGELKVYTIADGNKYTVTDFTGVLKSHPIGDNVDVTVQAKAHIYNDKAYIQYTC